MQRFDGSVLARVAGHIHAPIHPGVFMAIDQRRMGREVRRGRNARQDGILWRHRPPQARISWTIFDEKVGAARAKVLGSDQDINLQGIEGDIRAHLGESAHDELITVPVIAQIGDYPPPGKPLEGLGREIPLEGKPPAGADADSEARGDDDARRCPAIISNIS